MNKEIIEKAKNAKSAEEIAEIAKENGTQISLKYAEKLFEALKKSGEISDAELENAAGGGCGAPGDPVEYMKEYYGIHINCNKGVFFDKFETYWKCKICGASMIQNPLFGSVNLCNHARDMFGLSVSCQNCGWFEGGKCTCKR